MADGRHTVLIEKREKVNISGIEDVLSFDEEVIVSKTSMGIFIIRGEGLHINNLNLESGELAVDGTINSTEYEDIDSYTKPTASFFGKVFR